MHHMHVLLCRLRAFDLWPYAPVFANLTRNCMDHNCPLVGTHDFELAIRITLIGYYRGICYSP